MNGSILSVANGCTKMGFARASLSDRSMGLSVPGKGAMLDAKTATEIRQVLERALARLCPGWLQSSREDLVQEAMLKILQRPDLTEGNRRLKASYLYKTAHNVMIDEIRRVDRRRETSFDEAQIASIPGASSPGRECEGRALIQAMRSCLQKMVESRILGVTLHLQGHRVPEIARLLDWNIKQADNQVYRGLADLRDCLKMRGYQPA